ncbi:UDP-N-acetylmuramate dehydrogenase [Candidatus Saccharibacteria bacterium]|jgi:UDP-N-acetylmuramate dehydrogenase|nr:UDP-N-acetylmuramate dehydrogenase [Candidatus Saccharibacteria bacterium]
MSFQPQQNVDLAELTTFKIGGRAAFFTEVTSASQLPEIFAWLKQNSLPHLVLSGGSNTIFGDGIFRGLVIKISIMGFAVISESEKSAVIMVGSGEDWDEIVKRVVERGLSGMEALSGIPGLTGATPVQNIGAYGQELKDTVKSVEVFDTKSSELGSLSRAECDFGYRDSIFKSDLKGRYIITSVVFELSKKAPGVPNYKDVVSYFESHNIASPNLEQIRQAVLEIRRGKFVDPSIMPNAGSFFKNPVVTELVAKKIMQQNPDVKVYPEDTKIIPLEGGNYKIAAGWLIQNLGLKGLELEKVRIDPNHALVLENKGGASQKDLKELVSKIQDAAMQKYGIALEPEPVIVEF